MRGAEGVVHVGVGRARRARAPARGRSSSRRAPSGCSRAPARCPARAGRPPRRTSGPDHLGRLRAPARRSARRAAPDAGASEVSGSRPFGRPRCEQSTSRAPLLEQQLDRRQRGRGCARRRSRARPSSGTLKSTRTSTRCPLATSRSRTRPLAERRIRGARVAASGDRRARQHPLGQVDDAVRVAPLVVVPGDDLHELAVDHHRQRRVEDRRVRRGDDVGRDDRVLVVLEDALEAARVGLLGERRVDLLDARLAATPRTRGRRPSR